MQVKEILHSRKILTIGMDLTLLDAREFMAARRINHVPVVDETGRLAGLLTKHIVDRNISPNIGSLREKSADRDTLETKIHLVMNRTPKVVALDTEIADAADILAARKATCLLVINENRRFVGIITIVDLLRCLAKLTRRVETAS
ncbi:MAG: HPP family protein [Thermodesulfobacteriota bacterium]